MSFWDLPVSAPPNIGITWPCMTFYIGIEDLNPGPLQRTTSPVLAGLFRSVSDGIDEENE